MGRGLGSGQKWLSASGTAKFAMKVYKVHRELRAQDFNSRIRVKRPHPTTHPKRQPCLNPTLYFERNTFLAEENRRNPGTDLKFLLN